MARGDKVVVPENAPKAGEVYRHYKGDLYEVVFLAEHNDPDELCVVYKAKYADKNSVPDFPYFTRLLKNWNEEVVYNDIIMKRFTKTN
jgi:hypothetical protein